MKIKFEKEDNSIYAVSFNEVYKNKEHEELMWCEITMTKEDWKVRWEDDWKNVLNFTSFPEACSYVLKDYYKHTPHSNGKSFDI